MVGSWTSLVRLIVQRARAAPALVGLRLLGIVVAVALVCAVSLYSGAMADVMLQATLSPHGEDVTVGVTSSPGRPDGMPYPTLRRLDSYLRGAAAADLGLPVRSVSAHFQLPNPWQLTAWGQSGAVGSTSYGGGFIEYLDGIAAHARVLRGAFVGADRLPNGSIPVAVSRAAADSSGLAVGQRLALLVPDLSPGQRVPPLQVTAIYTPTSATDPYWQASSPPINSSSLGLLSQRAFNDLSMLATSTTPEYALAGGHPPLGDPLWGCLRDRGRTAALHHSGHPHGPRHDHLCHAGRRPEIFRGHICPAQHLALPAGRAGGADHPVLSDRLHRTGAGPPGRRDRVDAQPRRGGPPDPGYPGRRERPAGADRHRARTISGFASGRQDRPDLRFSALRQRAHRARWG